MSYEITSATFWNVKPMIAFIDSRCVILNEAATIELHNTGIGNYREEIKGWFFELIVDFTEPFTFIKAFDKWLNDYPNTKVIHMLKIASCPIIKNNPPIEHNLIKLLMPHIPSHIKITFYE